MQRRDQTVAGMGKKGRSVGVEYVGFEVQSSESSSIVFQMLHGSSEVRKRIWDVPCRSLVCCWWWYSTIGSNRTRVVGEGSSEGEHEGHGLS